ncbi:MAG: hypothetical protein DYG99_10520 [Bacteroidetes bacterium CHB5]|nr:hypothetical protein [Bacteroidetes bacterium CHB5]
MIKSEALIYLVNSMTKPEKKAFKMASLTSKTPNYVKLYNLITRDKSLTATSLKEKYLTLHKGATFETAVNYLYKILLGIMLELRKDQDSYYSLFDKILKARILFEKSLYQECFDLLNKVKASAVSFENYSALLISSRLELDYLLSLNFPRTDEKTLLHKHFKVNETLRVTQKIHQQSALYELLRHRMIYKGNARSEKQRTELNDLVVSEMSIVASSNLENFEINKLHQLFQANYLINVGDYKSALHSFYELNNLLEGNKHLWSDPPIYYVLMLEGILDSLRSLQNYEGMNHFILQLKKLKTPSLNFNTNVTCLIFLYELFPLLDRGDFFSCDVLIKKYNESLLKKSQLLSIARNAELSLYLALVHFGLKDFRKAQKTLSKIIFTSKDYSNLPLYRTIRLVNLMILYELKDFDLIKYETRSMKRDMHTIGKGYKIEKKIINFVNKPNLPISILKRQRAWEKIQKDFESLHHDVYELQTLRLFDFSAWIESKVKKIQLSEILERKRNVN